MNWNYRDAMFSRKLTVPGLIYGIGTGVIIAGVILGLWVMVLAIATL